MASRRGEARAAGCDASLVATLGLACLWPCMGSSATMHFRHAMSGSASVITTSWHAVVMAALYVLAMALCVWRRCDVGRVLTSSRAGAAGLLAGVLGFAGHALLVATPLVPGQVAATAVTLAGFALTVGFIVAHVVGWFSQLARLPLMRALGVLAASSALAYALQLACDLAVGTGMLYALVVCPLGSGVCLLLAGRASREGGAGECREVPGVGPVARACAVSAAVPDGAGGRRHAFVAQPFPGGLVVSGAATPSAGGESEASIPAALRALPWGRIAAIAALIYLEQALTSVLFQRYADWPRDNLTITLVGGLLIWLAACAVVRTASRGRPSDSRPVYIALFALLIVIYMAALLATVVLPASEGPVAERLLVCAGSSFRTLLWMALAMAVAEKGAPPLAAALAYVGVVLAVPVSRLASLAFSAMDPALVAALCAPGVIVPLAAVILFAVAVAFVLANARATRRLMEELAGSGAAAPADEPHDSRAQACSELARSCGLTPREAEVLELVCAGYSARHAGERLGISESTVVSHVSHIYRKASVSNRQQLIALVEQAGVQREG